MPPGMNPSKEDLEKGKKFVQEHLTEFLEEVGMKPEELRQFLLDRLNEKIKNTGWTDPSLAGLEALKLALMAARVGTWAAEGEMKALIEQVNGVMDVADLLNKIEVKVDRKVFVNVGKLSGEAGLGLSTDFAGGKIGAAAMAVEAGAESKITFPQVTIAGRNPTLTIGVSGGYGAGIEAKAGYQKGKGFGAKLGVVWGWGGSVGFNVGLDKPEGGEGGDANKHE